MDIKSITRTAAIMYADSMTNRETNTIKRRFVESVYVTNGNAELTVSELIDKMETDMRLSFSISEIEPIIKDPEYFTEKLQRTAEENKYCLLQKRYITLSSKPINEIEEVIDNYISQQSVSVPLCISDFKELIYRYLHSILNTNISAYSQIINPKKEFKIPRPNFDSFEDNEIDIINDFVRWDNEAKNIAIFKLINYCIEYAVVINNSSENVLSMSLKTKVFYLDNSLLYRAIGINGDTRKRRTLSFMRKCKESGQNFVISKFTREEFQNTINYHLHQLNQSTPFGRISPNTFKRYSSGDGFYQFYHEWRNGRINYGFDMFKTYILTQYKELIKEYKISEDFNVPFNEKEEPTIIDNYKNEIKEIKNTNRIEPHLMDARNLYWIECVRKSNNIDVASTKYYFVTSDQKLQSWDKNHSINQPLTLLPSQWMGLILKYVSRSSDDYRSFISFMNIPKDNSIISEDELQTVMAGISEMTEDFNRQNSIIESMVETKFEGILKGDIQENAKAFTKNKLEQEFERQIIEKESEKEKENKLHQEIVKQIKEESEKLFRRTEQERKLDKLQSIVKEIGSLENRKTNAENNSWKRFSAIRTKFFLIFIVVILVWVFIIEEVGWDKMEKATYYMAIVIFVCNLLYAMIYGKSFNPLKAIKVLQQKYINEEYIVFEYSDSEFQELVKLREQYKEDVGKIL